MKVREEEVVDANSLLGANHPRMKFQSQLVLLKVEKQEGEGRVSETV